MPTTYKKVSTGDTPSVEDPVLDVAEGVPMDNNGCVAGSQRGTGLDSSLYRLEY